MIAKLLALVLPLGLDTFAVAAALGALGIGARAQRRVTGLFVFFEAGMPLVGVALGRPLGSLIGGAADWVAIGVLLGFGLVTLLGLLEADEDDEAASLRRFVDARGGAMLLLGLSISLDELAIGFTLGLLRLPIVLVIGLIAIQTLGVTQAGLRLGDRVGAERRELAERVAGLALVTLALVLAAERAFS